MIYALTITIVAGLLILAVIGLGYGLLRRVVGAGGIGSLGGWRWYPSTFGWLLVPLAAILLARLFPEALVVLLFLPIFLWRGGRGRIFTWRPRRRKEGDDTIDGEYHRTDGK